METVTIQTKRPCCDRPSQFRAIVGVPRQRYTRRCRDCETTYEIQRQTLCEGEVRIDRLEWIDTRTLDYIKRYDTTTYGKGA